MSHNISPIYMKCEKNNNVKFIKPEYENQQCKGIEEYVKKNYVYMTFKNKLKFSPSRKSIHINPQHLDFYKLNCNKNFYYSSNCVICLEKKKLIVLTPCMHCCICQDCNDETVNNGITNCPICRKNIENKIHAKRIKKKRNQKRNIKLKSPIFSGYSSSSNSLFSKNRLSAKCSDLYLNSNCLINRILNFLTDKYCYFINFTGSRNNNISYSELKVKVENFLERNEELSFINFKKRINELEEIYKEKYKIQCMYNPDNKEFIDRDLYLFMNRDFLDDM